MENFNIFLVTTLAIVSTNYGAEQQDQKLGDPTTELAQTSLQAQQVNSAAEQNEIINRELDAYIEQQLKQLQVNSKIPDPPASVHEPRQSQDPTLRHDRLFDSAPRSPLQTTPLPAPPPSGGV